MPTNRSRRMRKIKEVIELDDSIETFFMTGKILPGTPAHEHFKGIVFDDVHEKAKNLWLRHKLRLLEEWKRRRFRGPFWAEWRFGK